MSEHADDSDALARMLAEMDSLYLLPDDDSRSERAEQTCRVMKQWIADSAHEVAASALGYLCGDALVPKALRETFTNEVIRAVGALARQQNVCREQGGQVVFVTGMEAAREYIVEHVQLALRKGVANV